MFVPKYVTVMPWDARSVTLTSSGVFGEEIVGSPFDVDLLGFTAGVSKSLVNFISKHMYVYPRNKKGCQSWNGM